MGVDQPGRYGGLAAPSGPPHAGPATPPRGPAPFSWGGENGDGMGGYYEALTAHFEMVALLTKLCDSPIEVELGSEVAAMFAAKFRAPVRVVPAGDRCDGIEGVVIVPQFLVRQYRVDFRIIMRSPDGPSVSVLVECDGHDFHERTPEQAMKDRERDRALSLDGWRLLRFTGREIRRRPERCVREICHHLATLMGF